MAAVLRSCGSRKQVPVLHGVDIRVGRGETAGIVGKSGSGKTTLGRALLGLIAPTAGTVTFDGADITALDEKARRPLRRRMQMIFQDPMSSLNPRHTIGRILTEPLVLHGFATSRKAALSLVHGVLDRVGLSRSTVERYSFELPADNASELVLRARWCSSPISCLPTRSSRVSMCPRKPKYSACSKS